MGLFDFLKKKPSNETVEQAKKTQSQPAMESSDAAEGKYPDVCALCGKPYTEVKWAGQYWHRKCKRQASKMAHRMV